MTVLYLIQPDQMELNGGDWQSSQRSEQACLPTDVTGRCRKHWQSQFNQHLGQDLASTFFLFPISSGSNGNSPCSVVACESNATNTLSFFFFFGCVGSSLLRAGFSLVAASRGYSSLQCVCFSCCGARALGVLASVAVVRGL